MVPKFVGRWLKKTGVTGFLRSNQEPRKRQQDLAREYWLCGACEDNFSKWENEFATQVFYPFVEQALHTARYGPWLAKFCASVSWRTLTYICSKSNVSKYDESYMKAIENAERRLSDFLLGRAENLYECEQHIFPLDVLSSITNMNAPSNLNRYFLRTIAMDIVGNSHYKYIFTKLPKFILLGVVQDDRSTKMRSSRVALRQGVLSPRKYVLSQGLAEYIYEKADQVARLSDAIPADQQAKIEEFLLRHPNKSRESETLKAIAEDVRLFGQRAFSDRGSGRITNT